ncbi:transporter substrate-binding domain-containing protein [Maribacter sp. 2307UL18-2]|uniref:transporter substrate-binding domain-containing protein n=1 Tax=Maribacter sp. 2307UL18-2 TaxID=3386274 RepID=UPI0039BD79AA
MTKKLILPFLICFSFATWSQEDIDPTNLLRVGYTTAPPFIVKNGQDLEGINIWLWERIAKDLNLEYELVPMYFPDMLDSLGNGDIDISINPLTITSERSKVMEFTDPFYASNSTIVVADVSGFRKLVRFIKAFFNQNFLKGLLILLFIIFLFGLLGWYFERKANSEHFRSNYRGIWDGVWWSAVTLTTVGYGDKAPKTRMGKIAALVLMFGGLLFISGLTASIASSLTVTQLNSNPEGFNEFKERPVGTIGNSGANQFLKEHFFKEIKTYDGLVLGLQGLKRGEVDAFMYDEPILKYRIREDSTFSKLNILPVKFDVQFYAFGIAKHQTELEQRISQRILEIMETQGWEVVLNEYGLTEL